MQIAQTELFAPVFLLFHAPTVDEAISLANSTDYALGASVFGYDSADVQKCVRGIKAGMVAVNDFAAYYATSLPFGGVKGSGYGRFGGEEGLRALCNVKSVCEETWWAKMLGIGTGIPPKLQYPVHRDGWDVCKGIIRTGYGVGVLEKGLGLWELLWALMRAEKSDHESSLKQSSRTVRNLEKKMA
jgi:hypothetical protein